MPAINKPRTHTHVHPASGYPVRLDLFLPVAAEDDLQPGRGFSLFSDPLYIFNINPNLNISSDMMMDLPTFVPSFAHR